jgi:hypothetical protein
MGIFLFTTESRPALGTTQPPIQWVLGALWLRRQRREADHSPPSSVEVKNAWSYIPIPKYASMALCSVKESTRTTLPLHLPLLFEAWQLKTQEVYLYHT